ncbi:LytTR family DNA-binding domain-containing protein [Ectobacillus polymachus]|uniref:LytTR family DNA-binding domain-containing protein n=1 Tax=Ectobacillus polymachus TaxID=1508806 RepID=UPI003A8C334F
MKGFTVESLLGVMSELLSDETSLAVSNTKEYVYYRPSNRIDLKIKPGDLVKKGTITYKAIMTKQKVAEFVSRDIFGVPYQGRAVPFFYEGDLVGCVTSIYPALINGKSFVTVKLNDRYVPVSLQKVIYVEAKDRRTFVYSEEYVGTHKYSLQEFEYFLPKDIFIRCHRSFIVNVNFIKEIFPDIHSTFILVMKNGIKIPVSQTYSSYFRKILGF